MYHMFFVNVKCHVNSHFSLSLKILNPQFLNPNPLMSLILLYAFISILHTNSFSLPHNHPLIPSCPSYQSYHPIVTPDTDTLLFASKNNEETTTRTMGLLTRGPPQKLFVPFVKWFWKTVWELMVNELGEIVPCSCPPIPPILPKILPPSPNVLPPLPSPPLSPSRFHWSFHS